MKNLTFAVLLSFIIILSCGEPSKKETMGIDKNRKLNVVSVNYPLHYFTQVIGGDFVEAIYPIPADVDPAYWNPTEKEIIIYQSADIILLNGAGYAKWVEKTSLPESRKVITSNKFMNKFIPLNEVSTHSHGPGGEHEHKGMAFTTWLNFRFALDQASVVKDELSSKLPTQKDYFEKNFIKLKSDLEALDEMMTKLSNKLQSNTLIGSHPVYQYLAGAYNLKMINVHWEPGEMPDRVEWENLDTQLKTNPSKTMLWEDEPLPQIAEELEQRGIQLVVFNPCGNRPDEGNFISLMNNNILNLSKIVN